MLFNLKKKKKKKKKKKEEKKKQIKTVMACLILSGHSLSLNAMISTQPLEVWHFTIAQTLKTD